MDLWVLNTSLTPSTLRGQGKENTYRKSNWEENIVTGRKQNKADERNENRLEAFVYSIISSVLYMELRFGSEKCHSLGR